MTKFNFQNPIFIITIVFFLAAIIISVSFLWPRWQEIGVNRELLERKKQELQQRDAIFLAVQKDKEMLKEYQRQLAIITSALPDDAEMNIPSLFRFLQTASAQTGLILTETGPFTIMPIGEGFNLEKTQFGIQVIGSYPSLKAFLIRLEKSARIISVESISFSAPEEEGLFTFDLEIRVHNFKEPEIIPPREEIKMEILKLPILEKLEPFPEVELEEMGRENPFIPF